MKHTLCLLFFTIVTLIGFAQSDTEVKYQRGYSLLKTNNTTEAYKILGDLKSSVKNTDTLYNYIIWYYLSAVGQIEENFRKKEKFDSSLKYGLEALGVIQENKTYFDSKFADREQWMIKNLIVSYFGLGQLEEANKLKAILYRRYKEKTLPKGLDGYFNFDFFTLENKNIWGYEWYPELPDDRFSSSFTKIVYYVYSQNSDGTDKEQLYRFHVLMFHQDTTNAKFDYILERQHESEAGLVSGSYYKYTYKKDIDYKKLKEDIKIIVSSKLEPDTRRTISKPKRN